MTTSFLPFRRRRNRSSVQAVALGAVLAVVAVGCGSSETEQSAESTVEAPSSTELPADALSVVVSDPPLADLVSRVAGSTVLVSSVVPIGADGHTYQPRPGDARVLADADVYIENGLNLNDVVTSFAVSNYPQGTAHYALAEAIPESEMIAADTPEEIAGHGHAHSFNAHFWPDTEYAIAYVNRIARIMTQVDPPNAPGYQERAAAFVAELEAMGAAFTTAIATIPEANRKMVVYHDSWSYFGRRYDIPVIGAIQPTDFSEPSAGELRDTIEQVRAAGVPAFFGSEVFPSDVLEVIEEESGAEYVADLSDDVLPGEVGSPEHSYIGMMVANVRTIVSALGGDPSALDAVDPARL